LKAVEIGIDVKYRWHDYDVLEIGIHSSNGMFSGVAYPYLSIDGLAKAASAIENFPTSISDTREIQFGGFGPETAGGCVNMRFFCKDSSGHAVVEVRMESKNESSVETIWDRGTQSSHFFGEIEAGAVDDFVRGLREIDQRKEGNAHLRFIHL
jgi:hypothetical protein